MQYRVGIITEENKKYVQLVPVDKEANAAGGEKTAESEAVEGTLMPDEYGRLIYVPKPEKKPKAHNKDEK